jgi:hypothetical protein
MKKYIIILLGTVLAWAGCKKAEIDIDSFAQPVFSQTFTFDGSYTTIYGGKSPDIYMFSDIINDSFSTRVSAFAKEACPMADCPNSLRFEFLDYEFLGDSTELNFFGADSTLYYETRIIAKGQDYFEFVILRVNDNIVYSGPIQLDGYSLELPAGPALIEFMAFRNQDRYSSSEFTLEPDNIESKFFYPLIGVDVEKDTAFNGYWYNVDFAGNVLDEIVWNNGDTTESIFLTDTLATLPVEVIATRNGNTTRANISGVNSDFIPPSLDINYSVNPKPASLLNQIKIQWADDSGAFWKSDLQPQPKTSYFRVLKDESYENNEKGQKTRKIRVEYDCFLYKDSFEPGKKMKGSGTLAIATF